MGSVNENGVPVESDTKATTKNALKMVNKSIDDELKQIPGLGGILEHRERILLLP